MSSHMLTEQEREQYRSDALYAGRTYHDLYGYPKEQAQAMVLVCMREQSAVDDVDYTLHGEEIEAVVKEVIDELYPEQQGEEHGQAEA